MTAMDKYPKKKRTALQKIVAQQREAHARS